MRTAPTPTKDLLKVEVESAYAAKVAELSARVEIRVSDPRRTGSGTAKATSVRVVAKFSSAGLDEEVWHQLHELASELQARCRAAGERVTIDLRSEPGLD